MPGDIGDRTDAYGLMWIEERRLAALPDVSPALLDELDVFLGHLKSASGAIARVVRLGNAGGIRLAAVGRKSLRA